MDVTFDFWTNLRGCGGGNVGVVLDFYVVEISFD